MSRTLSSGTLEALLAPQTEQLFFVIVEIDHTDLGSPLRIVNNTEAVVSNGDTYQPLAFKFTPPVEADGTIKSAAIVIDNVDRQLVEAMRTILTAADVTASLIRGATPNVIEAGPWAFKGREASFTSKHVSLSLVPDNPMRRTVSIVSYKNINFPGLYG